MKIAYADPPYLGCCHLYGHHHGDDGRCWDDLGTHWALMERLREEFPDGWALSCSSPSLAPLLSRYCWADCRVAAWVKPFASFKPNVTPGYCWEPVLFAGGRRRGRDEWSGRDWVSAMPPVFSGEARGVPGMKPAVFCHWVFDDLLGMQADDELVDLFPGSGAVARAWQRYQRQGKLFAAPSQNVVCGESAPDRSGRTCDKPSGHDGDHWTYARRDADVAGTGSRPRRGLRGRSCR